jgi:hypothetical protein
MSRLKDRTGQKINNWTFLEFIELTNKQNAKWLCECDCGNRVIVLAYNIVSGVSKKCLNCMALAHTKSYEGNIPSPIWTTILANARKRKKEFNISRDYSYNLFINQNNKCALSGLDIKFALNNKDYDLGNQTASLDRIDSNVGYIEGNIQWVHKDINIMKNVFSTEKLIEYCKSIVDHHDTKTDK